MQLFFRWFVSMNLLVALVPAFAQVSDFESLLNDHISIPRGQNYHFSNELVEYVTNGNPAQMDSIIVRRLRKLEPISLESAALLRVRTFLYSVRVNMESAISIGEKALDVATQLKDERSIADAHLQLGNYYRILGFLQISSEHTLQAAKIYKKIDPIGAALAYGGAAITSYRSGNFRQCIEEQLEALENYKALEPNQLNFLDRFQIMNGYNTLGLAYTDLNMPDSALWALEKADSASNVEQNVWNPTFWSVLIGGNKAAVYMLQKRYNLAYPLLRRDYDEMMRQDDRGLIYSASFHLVEYYITIGQKDSVRAIMKRISNWTEAKRDIRYWKILANATALEQDFKASQAALLRAIEIQDSSQARSEAINISRLRAIYEFDDLSANIKQLSDDVTRNRERLQMQWIIFSVSVLTLALVAGMYFIFNRRTKAQLRIIEQQKEEISFQNTLLKQTLSDLNNTQSQLVESAKLSVLGQMTSGIAHEINNPLNFISGGVQALELSLARILEQTKSDPENKHEVLEVEELLKTINNGVTRASKIIASLRSLTSPQLESNRISIVEPLDATLDLMAPRLRLEGVTVVKQYQAKNPWINGNVSELGQVFTNLIDNAVYAMKDQPEKRLEVSIRNDDMSLIITICDNGSGIPSSVTEKVFNPFFTTKPVGEGTGLGLPISYNIVKKYQGTMTFQCPKEGGTEFVISFPVYSQ